MLKSATPYTYPNMIRFGNPSQELIQLFVRVQMHLSFIMFKVPLLTQVRSGKILVEHEHSTFSMTRLLLAPVVHFTPENNVKGAVAGDAVLMN